MIEVKSSSARCSKQYYSGIKLILGQMIGNKVANNED